MSLSRTLIANCRNVYYFCSGGEDFTAVKYNKFGDDLEEVATPYRVFLCSFEGVGRAAPQFFSLINQRFSSLICSQTEIAVVGVV